MRKHSCRCCHRMVLIVPLWNWNKTYFANDGDGVSFNRTFMELKSVFFLTSRPYPLGFNRTFMELKYEKWIRRSWSLSVLIVPLWNWNNGNFEIDEEGNLVLIVPLWNWNLKGFARRLNVSWFNRTFMELKWKQRKRLSISVFVLIVPLWNWNSWWCSAASGSSKF